jgi:dienelactone hydrolase
MLNTQILNMNQVPFIFDTMFHLLKISGRLRSMPVNLSKQLIMQPYHFRLNGSYDFAGQMDGDLRRRAQKYFQAQDKSKDSLQSVEDFERYRAQTKAHFLEAIGGLPEEKTPLHARITGTIEEENFTIEKVLFESLPGYLVSAACYVPRGVTSNAPAVLFLCGHSGDGKAHDTYQKVCRDLVSNGFVVLAIDPLGQGNRLQYLKDGVDTQKSCTVEHTHAGFPFLLQGASVARHFVWDAIRAVDYLCERPEVDNARIGVTGNSGGGTQTSFLMLCEPRLAAAMPCTFITSLEQMMLSGFPQDMEQIVYKSMQRGPDHDDFLTGIAPRPVLLGAVSYDAFPIEGAIASYEKARKIYQLYNQPDNIQIVNDPSPHCYSDGLRQACVNWFKQHLKGETPDFVTGDPAILKPEELAVTPSGNVLQDNPGSRSIFDLNLELLEKIAPTENRSAEDLRRELIKVLGIDQAGSRKAAIHPRLTPGSHEEYQLEEIWFFSTPQIVVGGVLFFPKTAAKVLSTTLLILENGTADLPDNMALMEELLQQDKAVFVFDPRGIGSVQGRAVSAYGDEHAVFNSEYKMACDAAMLGISTMGLRIFDILRAFDYLHSREDIGQIEIHGIGHGANWAYFAAASEEDFAAVTCKDMLLSYKQLCQTKFYDHERFNLKMMAWGLLQCGDINDFLPCIIPRPIQLISPRDGEDQVFTAED